MAQRGIPTAGALPGPARPNRRPAVPAGPRAGTLHHGMIPFQHPSTTQHPQPCRATGTSRDPVPSQPPPPQETIHSLQNTGI